MYPRKPNEAIRNTNANSHANTAECCPIYLNGRKRTRVQDAILAVVPTSETRAAKSQLQFNDHHQARAKSYQLPYPEKDQRCSEFSVAWAAMRW